MTSTTDEAQTPFTLADRPPDSYTLIPWVHNQQTIFYRQFGSYQGEWIIVAVDQQGQYIFWRDYYGSCSGCDSLEGFFGYRESDPNRESATKFAEDYTPFLEVPRDTMINLVRGNNLASILPRNTGRGISSDIDYEELATTISVLAKLRENIDVTAQDIFDCTNAEIRRHALEQYGLEKFLSEMECITHDTDESGDSLIGISNRVFLLLTDPSTGHRYLLGVPDNLPNVRDAKGWTFGLRPGEYNPVVES